MAKKKEEMLEEVNESVGESKKNKKTKKAKKKTKAELKKALEGAEAVIINNDGCAIGYSDNNGIEFQLQTKGDSEILEVEDLRKMHLRKKDFFNKYWILIVDVICDDADITLEDVYDYIGIGKLYKDFENPDEDFFDDMLLETTVKEFKSMLEKMNNALVLQLFNRAVELYKKEEFTDSFKIKALENKMGRPDCFMDYNEE